MKSEKNIIKAVHDDNLEAFLKNAGLYDDLSAGKLKCKYCDSNITIANLGSIVPYSGNIFFVCDNPVCIAKLSSILNQ